MYASFHFHLTDTLSHKYWKYLYPDELDDVQAEDVAHYVRVISTAYREADRILGQILALTDEQTTVVIVSDHGVESESPRAMPVLNIKLLMQMIQLPDYVIPMHIGRR